MTTFEKAFDVAIPDGIDFGGFLFAQQMLETRVLVERDVGVVVVVGGLRGGFRRRFFAFG